MKKKFLTIFLLLNIFTFFRCVDCGDVKYYDYNSIEVIVRNSLVEANDSLSFGIEKPNINYMSMRQIFSNFENKAYAFGCDEGFGGPKFPITRISIKSNADFNQNLPAGSELNEIIFARGRNENDDYIYEAISQFLPSKINTGYMYIIERPTLNNVHRITIEIEKTNGEVLSSTSDDIIWE